MPAAPPAQLSATAAAAAAAGAAAASQLVAALVAYSAQVCPSTASKYQGAAQDAEGMLGSSEPVAAKGLEEEEIEAGEVMIDMALWRTRCNLTFFLNFVLNNPCPEQDTIDSTEPRARGEPQFVCVCVCVCVRARARARVKMLVKLSYSPECTKRL